LTILLEAQIHSKKMQRARSTFENNYIDSMNLYLNLYYIVEAKGLHNLQNLTINRLRQYYATKTKYLTSNVAIRCITKSSLDRL